MFKRWIGTMGNDSGTGVGFIESGQPYKEFYGEYLVMLRVKL
jgi:hypothetical protein